MFSQAYVDMITYPIFSEPEPEIPGLDFSHLKETMNPDFDWDGAVRAALGTSDSLEDVCSLDLLN